MGPDGCHAGEPGGRQAPAATAATVATWFWRRHLSLLGLDIGTSACKGLLLGSDGHEIDVANIEHGLAFPRPGWVELSAETVWADISEIISGLAAAGRENGDPVRALAFSVSGDEAVPVDADGHALYPCIMSMDTRTAELAATWERTVDADSVYALTGLPFAANWPLLRLIWLRDHEPQVFASTAQLLCWEDLMVARLTGSAVTDDSVASRTMAFEIGKRNWSEEILAVASVASSMFPRSVASGTVIGVVAPAQAASLGLAGDVLVVAGGFDQAMAALGAGLTHPGDAVVGTGTWEALTILTASPAIAPSLRTGGYTSGCYVTGDLYYCLASNPGGGSVVRWFRDTFGAAEVEVGRRTGIDAFDLLMREVPDGPTGMLALPHFEGSYNPWMDPSSTGAVLGLRLSTSRGHMLKALLEGITFELAENIARLEAAGITIGGLLATGGGARSPVWLQLKADITGRAVTRVAVAEAGCLAAACLAGVGAGVFASAGDAVAAVTRTAETYQPRAQIHARYQEAFSRYRGLYAAVRPLAAQPGNGPVSADSDGRG
jgi:xylulokinase